MPTTQHTQSLPQYQNTTTNPNTEVLSQEQPAPEKIISLPTSIPGFLMSTMRKKPKKTIEVPMFLRKTYNMINTSDPSIVCWSKDGKSFIIKDVDSFSTKVIPQFFNHKNFKSFVRQLNFYGFHKVKCDRIKKDAVLDKLEAKHSRFRHEHFRKGRPDLLEEIQKSKHSAVASQEEVDSLKDEVRELKSCIAVMAANIGRLNSFIDTAALQKPGVTVDAEYDPNAPRKRRRIEADTTPSASVAPQTYATGALVQQVSIPPSAVPLGVPSGPVYTEQVTQLNNAYIPDSIMPAKPADRMSSFGSIGSLNQDFLELFDEDDLDGVDEEKVIEKVAPEIALSSIPIKTDRDHDQEMWAKLHESFAALPRETQEFLVKHLDEAVASPDNLRRLIDMLSRSFTNERDEMKVAEGYRIPSLVPPEG
eukprot:CAMPEP_0185724730 /NCGR_PEP_ID=MMETSP1171-20130828/1123_1 /TAXON_ID=374046 /ORGANISM="Helicotheca tamensis, Strain CCMP826" /LENGTH=419 /DNA_ID=CAMNT_0028392651 /DNA_START=24 /DNA_END=1283 /DNA_ORIENTATION=-